MEGGYYDEDEGALSEAQADYFLREGGSSSQQNLINSAGGASDIVSELGIDEEDYLENASLYSIGLNRECFSKRLFMQWILYALWHGIVVFFTVFYCLNQPQTMQSDGKDIGFWACGMSVYGVCIFVANWELAIRFNTLNVVAFFTLCAGVLAYFLFYGLLSFVFSGNIDHLFVPTFKINLLYVSIFFCLA